MNNISKAAAEMGRKAAIVNKAKGSGYFSDLASKRWAKTVKCKKCGKRIAKTGFTMHYLGHYTPGGQGDNETT